MRSLLGRFHRPFARSVEEQLLLLNNLGDGSTLSLDFTTGVLDPRLTFTRTTNATFINSQGLVEWANSNMYWNTAFEGLSGSNPSLTSSGWGYALSTGGTAVFNGDGSVTVTTTAAERRAIFRSSGFSGGGLRVVASVDVTIASGSLQASQVIVTGTPTNAQHYVNGVIWDSSHPIWNGGILPVGTQFNIAYATDSVTSGTTSMYFGVGCTSVIAGSATFSNPRWTMWKGSATVPYYPNTSATNNSTANYFKSNDYQAPRFDHDPTTLQPRGLLIEGTSNNLARYSETLETTGSFWGYNAATRTVESSDVNPTGGTGSISFAPTTNGGSRYCGLFLTGQTTTTAYTYSVWLKGKGTNICVISIQNSAGAQNATMTILSQPSGGTASVTSTGGGFSVVSNLSTTGWTRVQVVLAATLGGTGTLNVFMYPKDTSVQTTADSLFAWGAQLETGSGASSYIPTGASTGSRAFDSCVMTGTNFSSWFAGATEGVLYGEAERPRKIESTAADHGIAGSRYQSGGWVGIGASANFQYPASVIWPTGGFQSAGGIATRIPLVSKQAVRWFNANDITNFANGTQGATNTSGTGTVTPAMLTIGANSTSGTAAGLEWFNGCIRRVKFWPVALPDSQIIALTT
jgi:hypothetical protein